MTVETKYSWNAKVWLLDTHAGKAREALIYEVMITFFSFTPLIRYKLDKSDGMIVDEAKLFASKEELLASL